MVRKSSANAGDLRGAGCIYGLRRSPGEGNGKPLQYFPGESHGQRNLVGYSPWRCKESDRTEATQHTVHTHIYMGSLGGSSGKEATCQCRRHKRCRFEPWVGRSPRGMQATHFCVLAYRIHGQRSLWAIVHRVTKSWTKLSNLVCLHTHVYVYYDSEKRHDEK